MAIRPTLIIAGTSSGCGKTTVSLGLMAAFGTRGLDVRPFKCGPDFIDPTLHTMITKRRSPNLDIRMCGNDHVQATFWRKAAAGPEGINIIEGVMGMFDGGQGSAAALASCLKVPVLLVVDISSAAESVAATVHGFETLDPGVEIGAVVLNRAASPRHAALAQGAVETHCRARVAGVLPRDLSITIPSRHLGLEMGDENPLDANGIERLAELMEQNLDLDMVCAVAQTASTVRPAAGDTIERVNTWCRDRARVRIAVARDEAFCFYYQDNLELLQAAGAETVEFSPVHDTALPDRIHGIYLGGGYPELHAGPLSKNGPMLKQIAAFCRQGGPVLAECGGFMYLTRSITCTSGHTFEMAGVFPFRCHMKSRLRRLGYRQPLLCRDTILGPRGQKLYGHEFHYSDIHAADGEKDRLKMAFEMEGGRMEGYQIYNTLAGYIHLHWGRTPEAAMNFADSCRRYARLQGENTW